MFRVSLAFLLLCSAPAHAAAPAKATWPTDKFVKWQTEWRDRTIEVSDVRVRAELKHCGTDPPSSERCWQGSPYLQVTVSAPGVAPIKIQGEPGVAQYVGIGRLRPNLTRPSVILVSEDGGTAGCAQIDVAMAHTGHYRVVRLDPDKNRGTICPVDTRTLRWPADLSGHGRSELLLPWPVFHCYFTSCAGTWVSRRVIALEDEKAVDVSGDAAFAPVFRANMQSAQRACKHNTVEAQGACAGYAFDAARLGRLAEAWPVIDAQVRRGCRVPNEIPCADGDHIPQDFHVKLAAVLAAAASKP